MLFFTAASQERVFRTIIIGHPLSTLCTANKVVGCDGGPPNCGILWDVRKPATCPGYRSPF